LLIAGGVIGYPFSLDQPVALERLVGLVAASALALLASVWLRGMLRPHALLIGSSLAALVGGAWVIAVSGPEVFRGTVGSALDVVFRPLFGVFVLTDPVEVSNTRFIVGYNGLADLCLVAIFGCGAVLVDNPRQRWSVGLIGVMVLSLVLLVGAGARGGLTGLAAGVCTAGVFAWPRRYMLAALIAAPAALVVAAVGILDKGLEFSSTAGRLSYWSDLARLLVEYPLTGVGLGVDTAYNVAVQYEINPDPDRVFYAHNTFVQTYLEMGPLGTLGMLLVPVVAIAAALIARRHGAVAGRRALVLSGLGLVGGLEAHGLTDQVLTTNVGTGLVLLSLAAILAGLSPEALGALSTWTRRSAVVLAAFLALAAGAFIGTPAGRAQALLNLGGLAMDQAFAASDESDDRATFLADAESRFTQALGQDATHPAVLRDLAWVRAARYDDTRAAEALKLAADLPRIDAFDMLQIAHVYRALGFADQAYAWAARAYDVRGRPVEDAVMRTYAQSTLNDSRARTLADQAEAAMQARHFTEAHSLFEQSLSFEPSNAYLQDRIGAAQRAIDKYGG
jgi:O-antigen ligase